MTITRVLGIDPSLAGSGLALVEFDQKTVTVKRLETIKTKPTNHIYQRILRYREIVSKLFRDFEKDTFVAIEAYSFLARGSAATALPELGALIRNYCHEHQIKWVEFSPTSVKKFGTGKGNAKKELVLMHVQQHYGHLLIGTGLELQDSNQADALVIAAMTASWFQWKAGKKDLPKTQLDVFKNMDKERFWMNEDSLI